MYYGNINKPKKRLRKGKIIGQNLKILKKKNWKKKIAPFLSHSKHVTKIKIIQKPHKKTPKPPTNKHRLRDGENGYFLDVFLQDQPSQRHPDLLPGDGGEPWRRPPCCHAVPSLGWGSCLSLWPWVPSCHLGCADT